MSGYFDKLPASKKSQIPGFCLLATNVVPLLKSKEVTVYISKGLLRSR
jgi:hypothetical protein